MKFKRSHQLISVLAIVVAVVLMLITLLVPGKPVTGITTPTTDRPLSVIQGDGQSVGQSIQGTELVPAPINTGLQTSGDTANLQPTGAIESK